MVKALSRTRVATPRAIAFISCMFLAATTWLVFGQTVRFPFVDFDDPLYVYENPHINRGLTARGLVWAFTDGPAPDWYPLTRLPYLTASQLDCRNGGGDHFTDVLLHGVSV